MNVKIFLRLSGCQLRLPAFRLTANDPCLPLRTEISMCLTAASACLLFRGLFRWPPFAAKWVASAKAAEKFEIEKTDSECAR